MDDATFTSDRAAMDRRSLLEQLAIIHSLFRKESSADDDDAATAAARNRNVVEGRAKEGVRLINDQMASVSTELLLTVMSDMMLLRLLDGLGLEEGRVVQSSDVASDQQLVLMDAATSEKKKKKRASAAAAKKKRSKQNKATAKNKKTELMSMSCGGLISLIMVAAFGSITMLISPLALIHPSDGSGEGKAPPALPPSASKALPQRDHQSNNVESVSPDIISPLPAVAVVPLSIFSPPTAVNRRRMKIRGRGLCIDTPNWKDKHGDGCDEYKLLYDPGCAGPYYTDEFAGSMGLASDHCCYCKDPSCKDFKSKCQKKTESDAKLSIEDTVGVMCEEAESCSCEAANHDVKIVNDKTFGLYNECKCDFWSHLCEGTGAGEACDYAAEYCCGDYTHNEAILILEQPEKFSYNTIPACYCDFFNYVQNELGHSLKPKAMNITIDFTDPCGQLGFGMHDDFRREEITSLEAIYNQTNSQNWTNNAGWMNETVDHCQWYGISCDIDGKVTGIDLRDNNLAGQFPVYTRNTKYNGYGWYPIKEGDWQLSKYGLANLHSLKTLNLADNKLTGTIEYAPLYNLHSLALFDVSGNLLSGEVDALVSPLLRYVDFSNNRFTSMRRFRKYKVSPLQSLRSCDVSNNAIQNNAIDLLENIPPNIEQFIASNNQIYGSLPDSLNNLPELRQFNMSSNALSGELPDFADSIFLLQELDLSNQTNGFTGSIHEDIWRFQSLNILNLASNKLTGTIPSANIGSMAVLQVLDLSNNLLESSIPAELGMLEGTLKRLGLANNILSGAIPSQLGKLQGASVLLEGNRFNNSIAPLSLCLEREVKEFDLSDNVTLCPQERNALSDFYDSAKGVEWTDGTLWLDEYASYCNWTGVTCEKNRVTKLNLANNGLSGRLSENIGNFTFIEVLDLSDNDIKGSIPTQIGLLSNLTYLRLSYNAFTGAAPVGLEGLAQLQLLQLQTNRITEIPNIPQLDESIYYKSAFVTDCGVPSAFDEALQCEHCTMCCNANEDCYPQEETLVAEHLGLNYSEFAALLIACFIALCCMVALSLYLFSKRKNRGNALTTSTERRLEEDDKYALSRIGKESVYSYFVTDKALGWLVAFATLGIQVGLLFVFVVASEVKLQDDKIDIQFTWKCPRDSDVCKNTADLAFAGWFIFSMLMIANLAKDMISGSKLIYHSSEVRHPLGSRIRYFIGGTLLCSITLFALYVSTVYNKAIATSNTEIIVNSVVVLFVMDLDEWIFAALEACNEKWTEHAADSENSSSDTKAEKGKGGAIDEMKDKIALQDAQIADQQKELMRQKIQIEQMARRSGELTELQEAVQNMQDSQAASSASFETIFYCDPNANDSVTSRADAVESEDAQLDADADAREGGTMNGTKMRNHYRKIKLGIRRGRPSKINTSSSGYNRL